jgi:hypothetical protein
MFVFDDALARFQKTPLRTRDFARDLADGVRVAPHLMARKNFGWNEEIQGAPPTKNAPG